MALDLSDCQLQGPALPEPFVKFELEKELTRLKLLPKTVDGWEFYRRRLRELTASGGPLRVRHQVIEPLLPLLGYERLENAPDVQTREDLEAGGVWLMTADGSARLRVWTTPFNEDLYAPAKRGRAYRFSPLRIAQRVLLATGERLGLLTNGVHVVVMLSDPARPDSTVTIPLDPGWKRSREVPDSLRFLLALATSAGLAALPELVDKARLQQARVTRELRLQARQAVEAFIQEILDHPANQDWFAAQTQRDALAPQLWREGLITVYRLLFILKLEASDDPARSFGFASTSLWRNTFSPSMALANYAPAVLEQGAETGGLLEAGLRALLRLFEHGLQCTELHIKPLGGALFGADATPILAQLTWGERAVAWLLDRLLWTPKKRGAATRERLHYGPLDVEDLGRVYEALLELEPGITTEPMCRLRRQKLEVVVPLAQGERYRPTQAVNGESSKDSAEGDLEETADEDEEPPARGKKTTVEWIELIPPNRFYLRVGLGRKASGSYYTPHSFVRFLVQETLGPQLAACSPPDNPQPLALLRLKVLDPAMGSGHFLVEACRFLGEKLYEACRLCDEQALAAERQAETGPPEDREAAAQQAQDCRRRLIGLSDPDDELLKFLPSRAPEGEVAGYSQERAKAICRRLVATHCLYGVDKNPLAVELAKLAVWLESHAEGLPLTFLDHRLVVGDSLTGPFWDRLIFRPGNPVEPVHNLFYQNLYIKFQKVLSKALGSVHRLEASVGISLAEMQEKQAAKAELDRALLPFRMVAAAWSGGVMGGPAHCDDHAYAEALRAIAETGDLPERLESDLLRQAIARGLGVEDIPAERDALYELIKTGRCVPALPYDLTFPEVFYPSGVPYARQGFHAVLGNPPWDAVRPKAKEFFASFDFDILAAPTKRERVMIEKRLMENVEIERLHRLYEENFDEQQRIHEVLFQHQVVLVNGQKTGGDPDLAKLFLERSPQLLKQEGFVGIVVPSAFHANEGATGIRRLYMEKMGLRCCYSFENKRKLFEIHSSFKFALIVAQAGKTTDSLACAFYLYDDEWLFREKEQQKPLYYTLEFIRRTGGEYLSLLELRSMQDLEIAEVCFANGEPFGQVCDRLGIRFGRELHMTDDAWRLTPTEHMLPNPNGEDPRDPDVAKRLFEMNYFILHEGKTFWQYEDKWSERPRILLALDKLQDRLKSWVENSRYYKLTFRNIAAATNERTVIASLLINAITSFSARTELNPKLLKNSTKLYILSWMNSYLCDFLVRKWVNMHVDPKHLELSPIPAKNCDQLFLAHQALRVICNHAGYAPLWHEQVGDIWREPNKPPFTCPVLAGDDERWAVRAAIDAVVAEAYGLSRDQYAHVLSTFSHASYPKAPVLCLARFDELKAIGLDAFTKKYDPYWDIPWNENLPQPVIELPLPAETAETTNAENFQLQARPKQRKVKPSR